MSKYFGAWIIPIILSAVIAGCSSGSAVELRTVDPEVPVETAVGSDVSRPLVLETEIVTDTVYDRRRTVRVDPVDGVMAANVATTGQEAFDVVLGGSLASSGTRVDGEVVHAWLGSATTLQGGQLGKNGEVVAPLVDRRLAWVIVVDAVQLVLPQRCAMGNDCNERDQLPVQIGVASIVDAQTGVEVWTSIG